MAQFMTPNESSTWQGWGAVAEASSVARPVEGYLASEELAASVAVAPGTVAVTIFQGKLAGDVS